MKKFEEVFGEPETERSKLYACMCDVRENCRRNIRMDDPEVMAGVLKECTKDFFRSAFRAQIAVPQEELDTAENVEKYNGAFWEDVEVMLLLRQVSNSRRIKALNVWENFKSDIGLIQDGIESENRRRTSGSGAKSKKNLAFALSFLPTAPMSSGSGRLSHPLTRSI